MKSKRVTSIALVVALLAVCAPLFAHHGNVAYDEGKMVVLKDATVTRLVWANPHCLILFDVKDDKGKVVHWAMEGGSPSALSNVGWNRNSLQPGDAISVYMHQSKLGTPSGRLNHIVRSDGSLLKDSTYALEAKEPAK